jgi:hypothetical protein
MRHGSPRANTATCGTGLFGSWRKEGASQKHECAPGTALLSRVARIINGSGILAVRGRLGREDGVVNLKAETFFPLRLDQASQVVRSHDYH